MSPIAEQDSSVATIVSANITWPWYRNLASLAPWALLGGLLLLRPNRNLRAWAVVLPLIGWWIICSIGYRYTYADGFADVVYPSAFGTAHGIAVVWAASHWIGRISYSVLRFLAAAFILYIAFATWSLTEGSIFRSILTEPALSMGAVLIAFTVAGFITCRRRYRPIAFGFWLLVFVTPLTVATSGFQYIWITYLYGSSSTVVYMALVWSIYGLGLWLVVLSFMALVWFNREYRRRFAPILNIPLDNRLKEASRDEVSHQQNEVEYAPGS